MAKPILTAARLRELFHYEPETGVFTRLIKKAGNATAGSCAGSINTIGYRQIRVDGSNYLGHRLAWLYVHGEWPIGQIDHIDGTRSNNAIGNLRDVSHAVNQQNRKRAKANASASLMGISFSSGRWVAHISINGKPRYIGRFGTEAQAHSAYLAAKRLHHEGNTL